MKRSRSVMLAATGVAREEIKAEDRAAAGPSRPPRAVLLWIAVLAVLLVSDPGPAVGSPSVTYSRDIAPILQANCQSCHRPGEIGPFSLLTYEDATATAELIKENTQRRVMPPWKPIEGYGEFQDTRRLTDQQIRTIAEWVDAGAPEGDPKDLPPPRSFVEGWALGTPDLVLDAGEAYKLPADGPDVYRNFVLPFRPQEDQWVTGLEVRPDRRSVVHHAIVYIDLEGESLALDAADPGPGYTTSGGGVGFFNVEAIGGWVPGNTPRFAPAGIGVKIPAKARLVLQVHYHPNGEPQQDRTRIGLHFARAPIRQQVYLMPVLNLFLQIPPGAERHAVRASFDVTSNITAWAIVPHMHLLGREMKVSATLPDGSVTPLVWITDWDFHWQETYFFKEPLNLPQGTRVELVAYYDNSEKNPHNPNWPPQLVRWGEETTDEMCLAVIAVTVDSEDLAGDDRD
jgi:mono/diheme cytochrome c family protein